MKNGLAVPLKYQDVHPAGVTPRNLGQVFMQEALLTSAKEAPLIIIQGIAGTSKTFYTLAAALEQIMREDKEYRRLIICRPNTPFDDEIGHLPGTEQEKIAPLMRPIVDNLEQILHKKEDTELVLNQKVEELFSSGLIQTEALTFIRGRSVVNTYLLIDEAQNMTPSQAKGIITRAGRGTKIILCGDPNQIDKPFLNKNSNGLSYAAKCMKGSKHCWQLTLSDTECERSALAMDAANRM